MPHFMHFTLIQFVVDISQIQVIFSTLEVVDCGSETQLQVTEKLNLLHQSLSVLNMITDSTWSCVTFVRRNTLI